MNTIIMNKEDYCLKDETININYNLNELVLTINGDVVINDLNNNKDLALKIILNDNSSLIYIVSDEIKNKTCDNWCQ